MAAAGIAIVAAIGGAFALLYSTADVPTALQAADAGHQDPLGGAGAGPSAPPAADDLLGNVTQSAGSLSDSLTSSLPAPIHT